MKLWFTRDEHDGDWKLWYDVPTPRPEKRRRSISDDDLVEVAEYRGQVEQLYGSDVEVLAFILGLELEPGEALLVDVRARMIEGSLRAIERHSDLATWAQVLEDVDDE